MMNVDAIRTILLVLRGMSGSEPLAGIEGLDVPTFTKHAMLLSDAGFVDGRMYSAGEHTQFCIRGLTSSGADFADAVATDGIWATVQEQIRDDGQPTVTALHVWVKAELFRGVAAES